MPDHSSIDDQFYDIVSDIMEPDSRMLFIKQQVSNLESSLDSLETLVDQLESLADHLSKKVKGLGNNI